MEGDWVRKESWKTKTNVLWLYYMYKKYLSNKNMFRYLNEQIKVIEVSSRRFLIFKILINEIQVLKK